MFLREGCAGRRVSGRQVGVRRDVVGRTASTRQLARAPARRGAERGDGRDRRDRARGGCGGCFSATATARDAGRVGRRERCGRRGGRPPGGGRARRGRSTERARPDRSWQSLSKRCALERSTRAKGEGGRRRVGTPDASESSNAERERAPGEGDGGTEASAGGRAEGDEGTGHPSADAERVIHRSGLNHGDLLSTS